MLDKFGHESQKITLDAREFDLDQGQIVDSRPLS